MHPEASQKRKRVVSWCVPEGCIRIVASPSQDGSTVNDEITSSDESPSQSLQDDKHKKRLVQRCPGSMATFAHLRFAWNADLSIFHWQSDCFSQRRPTLEPIMHVLIR
jgi:hypothetical protein